jgi:SAM-dependent methyltransferase
LLLSSGEITSGKRHRRSLRIRNALVACGLRLEGKRVLDLGCAEGLHSLYFAQRAAEVVGVDHRQSKILIADANAAALDAKNVRFIAGDIRDPEIFRSLGSFDLVVAWGFLHRITDIFSLLYSIEPLAKSLSLEWRTPVLPMMSRLSVAYHYPAAPFLDPMNIARHGGESEAAGNDKRKIEGDSGFWEPTPGAVAAITSRLGFAHARLLGYDEDLVPEEVILDRVWTRHLSDVAAGKALLEHLPRGRLHMLFEKERDAIKVDELKLGRVPLPKWDVGLQKSVARRISEN